MPDDLTAPATTTMGKEYIKWENIERAAKIALEQRRQAGEIMTYVIDGWVVREHPGRRIVRLAPLCEFRSEDFPIEE